MTKPTLHDKLEELERIATEESKSRWAMSVKYELTFDPQTVLAMIRCIKALANCGPQSHRSSCLMYSDVTGECSCGYDEVTNALTALYNEITEET